MADKIPIRIYPNPLIPLSLSLLILSLLLPRAATSPPPSPSPWPLQFHSILYINSSSGLQVTDLWYDWPNGRNFNIIQHQLGKKLYDLEWNNGTSFYYTLDANQECRTVHFAVGILRPNFLDGATYVGQERVDGFLCNVWEKVDFIRYYEDVDTKRPVSWTFISSGTRSHVMTFEVGKVLDDLNWQAPVYCFGNAKKHHNLHYHTPLLLRSTFGLNFMREIPSIPMGSN